jgi:hypothetical protein
MFGAAAASWRRRKQGAVLLAVTALHVLVMSWVDERTWDVVGENRRGDTESELSRGRD